MEQAVKVRLDSLEHFKKKELRVVCTMHSSVFLTSFLAFIYWIVAAAGRFNPRCTCVILFFGWMTCVYNDERVCTLQTMRTTVVVVEVI